MKHPVPKNKMESNREDLWLPHASMCEHINMVTNTIYINYIYML